MRQIPASTNQPLVYFPIIGDVRTTFIPIMLKLIFMFVLVSAARCAAQNGGVAISYGAKGLSSVTYGGVQYLAQGQFTVNAVTFVNSGGQISQGSVTGTAAYDPATQQTVLSYPWGSISIKYAVTGNRLTLAVKTQNSSSLTVQGVFFEPLDIQLPSAPNEFDGVTPILGENLGNPTALRLTAGGNALVLTNDDVTLPLIVGFPWSLNKPLNTVFPVRVETSQDPMFPNSIPFITRPIAPGMSDTYKLSFRFGASSASTKSLVSDLYQAFATAYPSTVNWPDRRPIGQLIMGSTATGFSSNPRGWFNDPAVDVTTPGGVAAFQQRVLAWASNSAMILKSLNAQGMITWDIEGEQYPQPTTYVGDPAMMSTLAPEMNGIVDQYFKTFTSAGLRVGICIRPQQLTIPPGRPPSQTAAADPSGLLISKIGYAYKRWGATLFYIDSNGDPNFPISSSFFQKVAAQYPQVLLIPEHQSASYFAFGSWYGELRGGVTGTPQTALDIYPQAFSVIYLPDGLYSQNRSTLQAAIRRGDIAMFRAWYADPQNQEIYDLYPSSGVAGPVPVISTPLDNATVSGTVDLSASVQTGPAGISNVRYLVDGVDTGVQLAAAPYRESFGTQNLSGGLHEVQAIAVDSVGDHGYASTNFFLAPTQPLLPSVTILTPGAQSPASGVLTIQAQPTAPAGVAFVQFSIDGQLLGGSQAGPLYQMLWNTLPLSNGSHSLSAKVTDQAGNSAVTSVSVQVANPTGSPYVAGSVFVPAGTEDLTTLGSADWIQWGMSADLSPNRKSGAAPQISGPAQIGNYHLYTYNNNPAGFSWSDGVPTAAESGVASGFFACAQGNGFRLTVPAGISAQRFTIFTGVYKSQLSVSAFLSDNSAPAYLDASVTNLGGQQAAAYRIDFRAGSPEQTLTVNVTQADSSVDLWSNITLSAATLSPDF